MESVRYHYEIEDYTGRPSEKDLDRRARDGWRLVSVVGHAEGTTAYFEKGVAVVRDEAEPPSGPARRQLESFHRHMVRMLQSHGNMPELQRIADGVEHFHSELLDVIRERLGDHPEFADLGDLTGDDARLVEALLAVRQVAQAPPDDADD